jgi:LPS sulfotransferase NodH
MTELTMPTFLADAASADELEKICCECSFDAEVFIFCMTPRVGSTALMSLLEDAGLCDRIEEILNPRGVVDQYVQEFGLTSFRQYIKTIRSSIGDRFAFKTSWNDFSFLAENRLFSSLFPRHRFVFLDRTDIDAQAVSLYVAQQSDFWHARRGVQSNRNTASIEYDQRKIEQVAWLIYLEKTKWASFFHSENIVPVTLLYEHFQDQMPEAAKVICRYFGLNDVCARVTSTASFLKLGGEYEDIVWRFRGDRLRSLSFKSGGN